MTADVPEWMLRFHEHHAAMGRHHEEQRSHVGNLFFTLDAALIALLGVMATADFMAGFPVLGRSAPALALALSGTFAAVFSLKQIERAAYHFAQAANYEHRILELQNDEVHLSRYQSTVQDHQKRWPRSHSTRLNWLWVWLHGAIAFVGFSLLLAWNLW